jgi:hypothetical protein
MFDYKMILEIVKAVLSVITLLIYLYCLNKFNKTEDIKAGIWAILALTITMGLY